LLSGEKMVPGTGPSGTQGPPGPQGPSPGPQGPIPAATVGDAPHASGCTGSWEGAGLPGELTPAEHGDTPHRTRSCLAQESEGGRRNGEDGQS
ncbi:unnamed protein product, partial [Bubo scandiacus]